MRTQYKRYREQTRPILKPNPRHFPKQQRGSCLSCYWNKKRQGGLFCDGCYGVAEVFSPRLSEVVLDWEEAA